MSVTVSNTSDVAASAAPRRIVHGVLRLGLFVAIVLMVAGLAVKLASGDRENDAIRLFHLGDAPSLGDALMGAGIVALGLTPAVRVLVLAGIWVRQRDWRFVGVAAAVVVTLALAMLLGGG